MKLGKSLTELAAEIERQQQAKQDFVASTKQIEIVPASDGFRLGLGVSGQFAPTALAHQQIGAFSNIPRAYYERMREQQPALLANNVKTWFEAEPAARLLRMLDGGNRAFLSDAYRPLENYDLAEAVLPTLLDHNLVIMSCEITEKRLYIKAVDQRITRDVPTGKQLGDASHNFFDTCSPAIIISNSEVGFGRLSVESGVYTKACTNLCMIAAGGMKRTHIGARHAAISDSVENIDRLLSSETRKATDKAIWLQVRDVVKGAFEEAVFDARVKKLAGLVEDKIEGDVVKVIELSAKKFGLSDLVRGSVQKHLIEGGDLTRYGLLNAVTRSAQDQANYDDATDLERLGGKIIELQPNEWRELSRAA